MNVVVLVGNVARDPELRYTPSGVAVCNFTLAVNRPFTNREGEREADFVRVVTWRKTAEFCGNYLEKGSLIGVNGRLQVRSWEPEEGQRRYITEVVAEAVNFVGPKRDGTARDGATRDEGAPGDQLDYEGEDVPF